MATLANKTVLIIGGSAGIGFAVAQSSLLSQAHKAIIASSKQERVYEAIELLKNNLSEKGVNGEIVGEVVNARDFNSVRQLFERVGEIDHLVWTSGEGLKLGFPNIDLDEVKDAFDVRFWGAARAAQIAKFKPGGSFTLTVGSVVVKPRSGWSLVAGVMGAVDSLTRGLAVDLAPIRVNVISPGLVKTELWASMAPEAREAMYTNAGNALLVKHVAEPHEIAEAYLFVMKCAYITGQRIEVDGGFKYL